MSRSLKIVFKDVDNNMKNINISEPKTDITGVEAKAFADFVLENEIFNGKNGVVKSYDGAYIITRSEVKL